MPIEFNMIAVILLPLVVALVISFLSTPIVKSFAYKLGAIDVPIVNLRLISSAS